MCWEHEYPVPVIYMNDDFEFDSPVLDVEDLFSAFVENAAWMGEIELSYTAFRKILDEFYSEHADRPSVIQIIEANIPEFMDLFDGVVQKCFV